MGKHVLLVGGRGHELTKVRNLGLRYSMIQIPERVTDEQRAGAVHYAVADYRDLPAILPIARSWHEADRFDAVVSFTEYGLEPASRCATALGVPGDNLVAVQATRDKTRTRALLGRAGLSPVRHRVCVAPDDARAFFAEIDGPIVLKPRAGGLSEGVFIVRDDAELVRHWAWTRAVEDGPLLAEEYLTGLEYSVESMSRDGVHEIVMITEKVTTGLPRFVELGHQLPARLDEADRTAIEKLILAFLNLIEQRTGPAHSELRLTPAGPRLIEAQTRTGGDQIWEMCELATGVDLIAETLTALLDLPAPARVPRAKAAAIRFFGYEDSTIVGVAGVADARRAPGVHRMVCSLAPGRELGPLNSSDARQGYVLSIGDSTDDALAKAHSALALVRVDRVPR